MKRNYIFLLFFFFFVHKINTDAYTHFLGFYILLFLNLWVNGMSREYLWDFGGFSEKSIYFFPLNNSDISEDITFPV